MAAFYICCSMHGNCNDPGPVTEVHGVVTDGITGKPIANLPMVISSSNNFDPHYFSTDINGKYDLKFTPQRPLYYGLRIASQAANNYLYIQNIGVKQGVDSLFNYKVYPAINVTVHLINHSDYSMNTFQLIINDTLATNLGDFPGGIYLNNQSLLIDTVVKYPMAHYSHASFTSDFLLNGNYQGEKAFKQSYILGNKDTLINVTNP